MTGLKAHRRDLDLPARAGEADLSPPSGAAFAATAGALLARAGAPAVAGAELAYARWKPGVSATAAYAVAFADGDTRWASWKRYRGDKAEHVAAHFRADEHEEAAADRLRPFARDPASGAFLYGFPADRVLRGGGRALDVQRTARFLRGAAAFAGANLRWHRSRATALRYKPERRAVLALDLAIRTGSGPDGLAVRRLGVRVLPVEHAERVAARRAAAFGAFGGGRGLAPRLLAHEPAAGILFEEWIDLEPAAASPAAAGAALARLHALNCAEADPPDRGAPAPCPEFALDPHLRAAFARVPLVEAENGPRAWIHGDCHADQFARPRGQSGADGAILLDLDELRPGALVLDLASWVADALAESPARSLASAGAELREGYCSAGGAWPAEAELRSAVARALVDRAAAAVRRLEAGAVPRALELLLRARDVAPRPHA